jgi:hypothetical protein
MVKDPKCSLIIAAVYCIAARFVPHEWHPMPTSKTTLESKGVSITRIHEKRFLEITTSLKKELEIQNYKIIKANSKALSSRYYKVLMNTGTYML